MKIPPMKYLAIGGPALAIGVIMMESVGRRKFPESLFRPTNLMNLLTDKSNIFFTNLGHYFAKFTNLYTLMVEYFPVQEIRDLSEGTLALAITPFSVLKGYHDYYTQAMTPIQYGIVSSAIVVGLGTAAGYYYWQPNWTDHIKGYFQK